MFHTFWYYYKLARGNLQFLVSKLNNQSALYYKEKFIFVIVLVPYKFALQFG